MKLFLKLKQFKDRKFLLLKQIYILKAVKKRLFSIVCDCLFDNFWIIVVYSKILTHYLICDNKAIGEGE